MNTIYPEDQKAFASGLTYYWGSLYGSSEALSLIEFDKGGKSMAIDTFYYGPKPLKGVNDAKELYDKVINK